MSATKKSNHRFISGNEALQYFAGLSKVDVSEYPVSTRLKAWQGIAYGVYKYEENLLNPVLLDKIKLVSLGVERQGPTGRVVSLVHGGSSELTVVPNAMYDGSFLMCFPQRTYFERTIQEFDDGGISLGISSCVQIYHKQRPDHQSSNVVFIDTWGNMRSKFVDYDSYSREVTRVSMGVTLI